MLDLFESSHQHKEPGEKKLVQELLKENAQEIGKTACKELLKTKDEEVANFNLGELKNQYQEQYVPGKF